MKINNQHQFLKQERIIHKFILYKRFGDWEEVREHMKIFDAKVWEIKQRIKRMNLSEKQTNIRFKEEFAKLKELQKWKKNASIVKKNWKGRNQSLYLQSKNMEWLVVQIISSALIFVYAGGLLKSLKLA